MPGPDFVVTKQHRQFTEFCDAVRHHRYIGLRYGPPGAGKTLSARHDAPWDIVHPYLEDYAEVPCRHLPDPRLRRSRDR